MAASKRPKHKKTALTKSESMARVRSKNTKPELLLRKALWARGLRYRIHVKDLPGRPDIVFSGSRLAIFVHGCFWHHHGCPRSSKMPRTNIEFWEKKIAANVSRDERTRAELKELGWSSIIAWECQPIEATVRVVSRHLDRSK